MPTLDPNGDYLVSAWNNHVYPLAARMNMDLKRPPVQPRSRLAHEAAKWAESLGRFEEYHIGLFRAFFSHGKDISNIDVLLELAAGLGLNTQALHNSLAESEFTARVLADKQEAVQAGVRAVPAFAVNGSLLAAGVQTAERLKELLARCG